MYIFSILYFQIYVSSLWYKIRNDSVEQVKEFRYLGSLTEDNRPTKEIMRRIALAKQAFEKKRSILMNKNLGNKLGRVLLKRISGV